jgi:hypothetical protein
MDLSQLIAEIDKLDYDDERDERMGLLLIYLKKVAMKVDVRSPKQSKISAIMYRLVFSVIETVRWESTRGPIAALSRAYYYTLRSRDGYIRACWDTASMAEAACDVDVNNV